MKDKQLLWLRISFMILLVGLFVVCGLIIRREIIRANALKNIGQNVIAISLDREDTTEGFTSGNTMSHNKKKEKVVDGSVADKQSAKYVKERLTRIYSLALSEDWEKREMAEKYKSVSFRELEKQCAAVESEPEYGDWYMDCGDWIFTQDEENPKIASVTVNDITMDSAFATVVIDVFGDSHSMQEVNIWLVFENGDWFIDDFQPKEFKECDGKTLREEMAYYLNCHQQSAE